MGRNPVVSAGGRPVWTCFPLAGELLALAASIFGRDDTKGRWAGEWGSEDTGTHGEYALSVVDAGS